MPPRRGTYPQDLLRPSQNDLGESQRWNAGFPKPKLLGTASYSYLGDRSNRRSSLRDGKVVSSIDRLPSDFERFVAIARKSQDEPTPEEMREWEALQRRRKEDEAEMERRMLEASKVKAIKKRAVSARVRRRGSVRSDLSRASSSRNSCRANTRRPLPASLATEGTAPRSRGPKPRGGT